MQCGRAQRTSTFDCSPRSRQPHLKTRLIALRGRAARRCGRRKNFNRRERREEQSKKRRGRSLSSSSLELERAQSDQFEFTLEKLPGTRCGDSRACRDKNLERRCGGVFSERPRKKNKQGRVRERTLEYRT